MFKKFSISMSIYTGIVLISSFYIGLNTNNPFTAMMISITVSTILSIPFFIYWKKRIAEIQWNLTLRKLKLLPKNQGWS